MTEGAPPPDPRLSLRQVIPNLMTVAAICAGLTAIRFAIDERFGEAVALILVAAVLDGLDGRVARLLRTESAIGAELDSLADFLNFGAATGLTVYLWALQDLRSVGWIAVLVYTICCVMRLARFNVGSRAEAKTDGFVGVPSPGGAMLALLPLFLGEALVGRSSLPEPIVGLWLIAVGLSMISRVPTPSLSGARLPAEWVRPLVVGAVVLFALLFTWPWATLFALDVAYLSVLAWGVARYRKDAADAD